MVHNWFAEISTPSWAIRGLTSQSVFGRCCTTGHLGSTERSSSNNAGGWEGPSICCWCFLLGTKCLWSFHVSRQREKPHKKANCVLEASLCLTISGNWFFFCFDPRSNPIPASKICEFPHEHCPFLLRILWVLNFRKHLSSCINRIIEAKCPGIRNIFGRLVQVHSNTRNTVDRLDVL